MSENTAFKLFEVELDRLVKTFDKNISAYKSSVYDEASLRQEFLNPFFRALGWDIENRAGRIPQRREVETESRTQIGGRQKRADYLFRTHPTDRFVCEAKKPAEELHATYAFQAKRYAWNKGLVLAILSDFEEMKIYIVGGRPNKDEADAGLWQSWHYRQYPLVAKELWSLLARDRVAAGSIEQLVDSLPRKPAGKGKRGWLIRPERSRALDTDFLNFLDEARRELASDLLRHNDRADILEGTALNDAVQHILDRILFLRICEDRDIDTGRSMESMIRDWGESTVHSNPPVHTSASGPRAAKGALWNVLLRHFRALDRRPRSHIPFFNGNLFKPHPSEELVVSDEWLAAFLGEIGADESPYLFNYMPVEILGTIYERFLGKIVRPKGRGVVIEEKPQVRKAGGVYYTPRYIVEQIVSETVGKALAGKTPEEALNLRILDPACGSGSFLICAFEAVCEHCQQWFTDHPKSRKKDWCWAAKTSVHLTTKAKRRILLETIRGVDIDPQAVEVTQLSLYLKMLEEENRVTLSHERDLFGGDDALLPPLQDNIKCGNSLIASDFSLVPDELLRVRAFDWPVQFDAIIGAGGFDAVIGNPPWVSLTGKFGNDICSEDEITYLTATHHGNTYMPNLYEYFVSQGLSLTKHGGSFGFVVPDRLGFNAQFVNLRRRILTEASDIRFCYKVPFPDVTVDTLVFAMCRIPPSSKAVVQIVEHGKQPLNQRQSEILAHPTHTFEYFENAGLMELLKKVERLPHVKRLSEVCNTTSGFGGKSDLITE